MKWLPLLASMLAAFALGITIVLDVDYLSGVIHDEWKAVALHEAEVEIERAEDEMVAGSDRELNELRQLDEALGMGAVTET